MVVNVPSRLAMEAVIREAREEVKAASISHAATVPSTVTRRSLIRRARQQVEAVAISRAATVIPSAGDSGKIVRNAKNAMNRIELGPAGISSVLSEISLGDNVNESDSMQWQWRQQDNSSCGDHAQLEQRRVGSDSECKNYCAADGRCWAAVMYYHSGNLCRKFTECSREYSEGSAITFKKYPITGALGEAVLEDDMKDAWTLLAFSAAHSVSAVDMRPHVPSMRASAGRMMISWSESSSPSNSRDFSTYEKVVKFTVPGSIASTASGSSRSGQQCSNNAYFTPVDVQCVKGACNMPSRMYTGTGFGPICYGRAYGLVLNSGNHQCDWGMDGQPYKSVYLGMAGCHGVKDTTGRLVANRALAAIAIWTRKPEIDCVMHVWSGWSACSQPCGSGGQERTRAVRQNAKYGGAACPDAREWRRNCVMDAWGGWGACSKPCGTGGEERTRAVQHSAEYGGAACPDAREWRRNCVMDAWGEWGACSKPCGTGREERTRAVKHSAEYGGAACPNAREWRQNCVVNDWTDWGECSKSCGGGEMLRNRTVKTKAQYGGNACPELENSSNCSTDDCLVRSMAFGWVACPGRALVYFAAVCFMHTVLQ
eukprot:TRINITY_DN7010_c0_g1_i1.p1 TRINITY_DN7010_c0_g1~~TRINITY_DN7010_c0_g1_i1.p1  ORF type:complete len:632 (-),score=83.96 TRINITY_DN7010_c0_g1_i1:131-1924(-)